MSLITKPTSATAPEYFASAWQRAFSQQMETGMQHDETIEAVLTADCEHLFTGEYYWENGFQFFMVEGIGKNRSYFSTSERPDRANVMENQS